MFRNIYLFIIRDYHEKNTFVLTVKSETKRFKIQEDDKEERIDGIKLINLTKKGYFLDLFSLINYTF